MAAPLPAIRNISGPGQGHSNTVTQRRVPSPPNKNRPAGQYVKPTLMKTRKESRFSMKQQMMRITQPELSSLDTQRYRNTYFHNLCLEMLKDGFHRSFSEIFALVKEQQNEIEAAGTDSLIQDRTLLADMHSKLDAMKAHLTQAELGLRTGNMDGVYEQRQALAKYFLETDDLRLSDHFFNSCLETALQIQGAPGKRKEAEAHCNLGLAYERRREFDLATEHFEAYYKLTGGKTEWITDEGQTLYATACEHLRRLYTTIAQSSHVDDHAAQQEAIIYLQKAFEMAKESGDEHKEGDASYRLGLAYEHSGDCETALMYHTRFMDVCKKIKDQEGMGSACEAIAKCYEKQGQLDEAVRYLEMFVDLAGGSKQEKAQGRASTCLGAIFNSLGQYEKASHHFGKAYNIARGMGDSASLEESRVQFGIASAHKALGNFVSLLEDPTRKQTSHLIGWKDLRKPLTDEGSQKV